MVVVKIELWPRGDESRAEKIGEARISLVAISHENKVGDYEVELRHAGTFRNKPGNWKTGSLKGHLRKLSPYHLVMRAMAACIGR